MAPNAFECQRSLSCAGLWHIPRTYSRVRRRSPSPASTRHRYAHARVLVVQVWLMAEEPVPVVLLADRVERPVRRFGVDEDDAGVGVAVVLVGPHEEVAVRPRRVSSRGLEPRMLVGRVVDD